MSRLKQLGKDSLIYGIGGVVAKGISFFLLPIFTRIFTPAEYGVIEMLVVLTSLLGAFLVMGMDSAQSFYFFERKNAGQPAQAELVSAILQWRLGWGAFIVVIATACAPLLNALLFAGGLDWYYFAVAFASSFLGSIMSQSAEIFRLLYRPWPYISLMLCQTILSATVVVALVLYFGWGLIAFFVASLLASLLVGMLGWYLVRDYLDFRSLHSEWWPRLLKFGVPLVPASLAMYGMNTSGRWFMQYYHGAEELGLYAVGAKFALLVALVVEMFRKAWWPMAMDAMHGPDGPETFRMIARIYMGFGVSALIALTFLSPWLVRYLTGPDFHQAWPIIGVLAWQPLFYGFFLVAGAGIWKAEKTYLTMYLMAGAVLVNIVLSILLVPDYHGFGAALATALTFFVWICASMYLSEGLWRVGFPLGVLASQIAAGIFVVGWLIASFETQSTMLRMGVAGVTGLVLLYLSIDREQRRSLRAAWVGR